LRCAIVGSGFGAGVAVGSCAIVTVPAINATAGKTHHFIHEFFMVLIS
jgi:hypothetical protein